jgi:siroheme synthase
MAAGSFRTKSRIKRLQRWCAVSDRFFALFALARIPAKTLRHRNALTLFAAVPSQARGVSVSKLAASNDDLAILLGVQRTGRIRSPCTVL